jgi:predicted CoA-binding protein
MDIWCFLKSNNMTKEKIQQFFASKQIAVVGVSENKVKFGGSLYRELSKAGYNMVPVNPHLQEFEGKKCYASVSDLPAETDAVIIVTKPAQAIEIVKEAERKGIKQIWLQQGSEDNDIIEYVKGKDMNVIYKKCAIMFGNPKGFHGFHAFLTKLFGKFPK